MSIGGMFTCHGVTIVEMGVSVPMLFNFSSFRSYLVELVGREMVICPFGNFFLLDDLNPS